jgi:hypothetical protein
VILGVDPAEIDEQTARTVGSLVMALVNGLAPQHLIDAEHAPSGADLAAAVRRLQDG